jgi:hypothetical protein
VFGPEEKKRNKTRAQISLIITHSGGAIPPVFYFLFVVPEVTERYK